MLWVEFAASARIGLADLLLASGNQAEAATQADSACAAVERLLMRDPKVQYWKRLLRDCLAVRSEIALKGSGGTEALPIATRALDAAKSSTSGDRIADSFALAKAWRLIGDSRRALGDGTGARSAWESGFAALPTTAPERPAELAERLLLLQRLGRAGEAQQAAGRLRAIGYRRLT
jgi:hypothetical protein